jgi:hypothetical protein
VSVDAGCDSGSASASFSMAIPAHHRDSFIRDAQFILRAGLEVHIYMRGYFPVKGLYSNLAKPTTQIPKGLPTPTESLPPDPQNNPIGKGIPKPGEGKRLTPEQWRDFYEPAFRAAAERYPGWDQAKQDSAVAHALIMSYNEMGVADGKKGVTTAYSRKDNGVFSQPGRGDAGTVDVATSEWVLNGVIVKESTPGAVKTHVTVKKAKFSSPEEAAYSHYLYTKGDAPGFTKYHWGSYPTILKKMGIVDFGTKEKPDVRSTKQNAEADAIKANLAASQVKGGSVTTGPSLLEDMDMNGYDIENVLAYPYYHVFHGVMTQVSHAYSAGTTTASIQCVSMLHFWQYQQMSSNASAFGPRAPNSGLKMSMVGHNFTGKHPYEIMYILHHDTAGAAGGVSWALSQKTNQTASSDVTGESLYSLNIKYWEKRFGLRDIKLRMHGISGEMFNSVQAAFLARMSSDDLMALVRGRFNNAGVKAGGDSILSQAVSVGLFNKRKLEALLQARTRRGPEGSKSDPSLEINVTEMEAFVTDISQWGNIQLFESTYESKLDIANKVCEVTGFEFYQDVDGDFVFKPPMYNLDTSSSRVYRIENIDIISINFEDKEPQVTYMTCKGSHFHNVKGTGTDNEMGVQGQYIDYRLVAQFGWRPGNFESSYFTDPKSLFYAAVNRLDVLNAPVKSASVTIPLRPELRPGYPVYIPYLDAFYYCNSFAHSFSVGGGCTTTLQLIAKRSKFYAPGDPSKQGIDAIDLGETLLPEKPLEVLDNNGLPRLSGFPNVVMALDPSRIDPLFFIVGSNVDNLNSPGVLEELMKKAVELSIVTPMPEPSDPAGPYYVMGKVDDPMSVWFYFKTKNSKYPDASWPKGRKLDVRKMAEKWMAAQTKVGIRVAKAQPKLQRMADDAAAKAAAYSALNRKSATEGDVPAKAINAAANKAKVASDKLKKATETLAKSQEAVSGAVSEEDSSALGTFRWLVKRVTEEFGRPDTFQSKFSGDPNASVTLLELLSDKKAVFSTRSLPGSYRYFSASHPDPKHQGQDLLSLVISKEADTPAKRQITSSAFLDPLWQGSQCQTYVRTPVTSPDGLKPEAALEPGSPSRGMLVFTNNPDFPAGEVMPTSEIRELMFASHQLFAERSRQSDAHVHVTQLVGTDFIEKWKYVATKKTAIGVGSPADTNTLEEAMTPFVTALTKIIKSSFDAVKASQNEVIRVKIPDFPPVVKPATVTVNGYQVVTTVPMNNYQFAGDTDPNKKPAYPGSENTPIRLVWDDLAKEYAASYYYAFVSSADQWVAKMGETDIPPDNIVYIKSTFYAAVASSTMVPMSTNIPRIGNKTMRAVKGKKGKKGNGSILVPTPVFPISDAQGYHVVGSYRYGRDVGIDPDGVFDSLHRQDVFTMLDKDTVDNILRAVIKNEDITVTEPDPKNPKLLKTRVIAKGTAAKTYMEGQVLKALRKDFTDQDLIDMGKVKATSNGLELDLNACIADGRDGITKVPINNAAYALADLAPHTSRDFCTCKASEASVLLDIAGTRDFVQFTEAGKKTYGTPDSEGSLDRTTQWIKDTTANQAISWSQSQAALRGAIPNQGPVSVIQAFNGSQGSSDEMARQLDAKKAAFEAAKAALKPKEE